METETRSLTSHGQNNGIPPILAFCDVLETRNWTGPAYTQGLAAAFNITVAFDAFLTGIAETDPDVWAIAGPPSDAADTLSWTYQYCTEFGTFSTISLTRGLRTGLILCVRRFLPGCESSQQPKHSVAILEPGVRATDLLELLPRGNDPT